MYAVVNHMKLSKSLDDSIIGRMNSELMSDIAKMPGVDNAICVQVSDDGIVVIVMCESAESLERVHQEVGLPWVRGIALGHTNNEIAEQLYLSVRTVESHRAHIQQKLAMTTRSELVRYAIERGLIDV